MTMTEMRMWLLSAVDMKSTWSKPSRPMNQFSRP
jgi:hypothetical protein